MKFSCVLCVLHKVLYCKNSKTRFLWHCNNRKVYYILWLWYAYFKPSWSLQHFKSKTSTSEWNWLTLCKTDSVWNFWETMMNPLSTTNPFSTDTTGINLSSQSVAYLYSIPYLSTNHLRPSFPSTFHNSLLPLWLIHHKNKIIWIPQLKRE